MKNSLQIPGDGPGDAEEEPVVDAPGEGEVPTVGDAGLGGEGARRFVAAAQGVGWADQAMDQAVKQAAEQHRQAQLLMTQPGVGPVTALAFVLTIGDVARFAGSKRLTGYLGLVPRSTARVASVTWEPLPNEATVFYASCWWKRRRPQCARMKVFAKRIKSVAVVALREWLRWRRHASWQCDSTGCYVAMSAIRRSLVSRATRGCPWEMFSP